MINYSDEYLIKALRDNIANKINNFLIIKEEKAWLKTWEDFLEFLIKYNKERHSERAEERIFNKAKKSKDSDTMDINNTKVRKVTFQCKMHEKNSMHNDADCYI